MSWIRLRTELRQEIERTAGRMRALGLRFTPDSCYVQIQDEGMSWWQPVAALLPILQELPDLCPGEERGVCRQSWRRAVAMAGSFGGCGMPDTLPVPADFDAPTDIP